MARANNNTNPEETKVEETKVEETKVEETKTDEVPAKTMAKEVEVYIPRGSNANDDPNMFVSVNGVNYLLPRGKKSVVPVEVAEEIERSKKAQEALDQRIDEMLGASK